MSVGECAGWAMGTHVRWCDGKQVSRLDAALCSPDCLGAYDSYGEREAAADAGEDT